jgi:hypothetical protein
MGLKHQIQGGGTSMTTSKSRPTLSPETKTNWWLDATDFLFALVSVISGAYFLFLPTGGYQGGRNPMYGVTILFTRENWDLLHMWGGVLMIIAVVFHLWLHRQWVVMMTRKLVNQARGQGSRLSKGGKINLWVDAAIALGFALTAITGIYLMFAPAGGYQGGRNLAWDPGFLFTRTTWDLIHTWSAVAMVAAAFLHLIIHWRWVTKVTGKMFGRVAAIPRRQSASVSNTSY